MRVSYIAETLTHFLGGALKTCLGQSVGVRLWFGSALVPISAHMIKLDDRSSLSLRLSPTEQRSAPGVPRYRDPRAFDPVLGFFGPMRRPCLVRE